MNDLLSRDLDLKISDLEKRIKILELQINLEQKSKELELIKSSSYTKNDQDFINSNQKIDSSLGEQLRVLVRNKNSYIFAEDDNLKALDYNYIASKRRRYGRMLEIVFFDVLKKDFPNSWKNQNYDCSLTYDFIINNKHIDLKSTNYYHSKNEFGSLIEIDNLISNWINTDNDNIVLQYIVYDDAFDDKRNEIKFELIGFYDRAKLIKAWDDYSKYRGNSKLGCCISKNNKNFFKITKAGLYHPDLLNDYIFGVKNTYAANSATLRASSLEDIIEKYSKYPGFCINFIKWTYNNCSLCETGDQIGVQINGHHNKRGKYPKPFSNRVGQIIINRSKKVIFQESIFKGTKLFVGQKRPRVDGNKFYDLLKDLDLLKSSEIPF